MTPITTTFVRNGFGELIREASPDRGTFLYYCDAAGARIAEIGGRSQCIDMVRDVLGRVLARTPLGLPAAHAIRPSPGRLHHPFPGDHYNLYRARRLFGKSGAALAKLVAH